jgi:two-component system sensor histidine kinase BaeS
MLNSLRFRLILSHVLPLVVIIPLMGLVLVYTLETKVLLVNLSKDLESQAVLFAEIADDYASMWQDPDQAQAFVTRFSPHLGAQVTLLSPDGLLLASSDPANAERLGQPFEPFQRADLMAGHLSVETSYSRQQLAEIIQVSIPVMRPSQKVLGVIRLSHRLSGVYDWFRDLRAVSITVLAAALLLGSASGLILAHNIERPLQQITQAILRLTSGRKLTPLPAKGAGEIQVLVSAFNSLVERLQSLEQARRQLLANLVHELRRPLGALYSAVEALIGGAGEDAELRLELLEGMEEQVERLQRLLGDLAQLHDQVLGTLELDHQPVPLSTWLSHELAPWREAARRAGLNWETRIPSDLPTLDADPDRLAQAVGNLLSNAIKYTPAGGSVSIKASATGEVACIQVSDTGPGIAAEEQERIFSPFYRGHTSGRFPQGMGLGLTIARDLIVAHEGLLEVESTPGEGSHFTIRLPAPSQQKQS